MAGKKTTFALFFGKEQSKDEAPERVGQIYQEATSLSKSVNNFLVLAKLRHEGQGLSHPAEAAS